MLFSVIKTHPNSTISFAAYKCYILFCFTASIKTSLEIYPSFNVGRKLFIAKTYSFCRAMKGKKKGLFN